MTEPPRALRREPAFRALWTARAVSVAGDSAGLVALLLYLSDGAGQAFAVAALLLVGDVAPALLGPLTGTLGDRFDARRLMIACELVQAATVGALALTLPPLPALLALVALRSVAAQIGQSAARAALPAIVDGPRLGAANAALGLGSNGMEAVGPLAAAALLPVAGISGVLVLDAGSFVVSAALLAFLPALPRPGGGPGARPSLLADARDGLRYLRSTRLVRALCLGFVGVVACNGVDDVALVYLARDALGAGEQVVAALYAAVGIGLLVGYLVLARRTGRLVLLVVAGFVVSSAGNLLTGLAWAVAVAFGLQLLRGAGLAAIDVGVNTLLQRVVPPALLARVFGTLYGGIGAAAGLSYLLGAVLLEAAGPRVTFVTAGAAGLVVTAVALLALRRADEPVP